MEPPKTEVRELNEHERVALVKDKSQEIGTFIEWLGEQGIFLAKCVEARLFLHHEPIQKLLARYYNIDLDKLEREKREMLAEIRKQHAARQIDKELGLS